MVIASQRLVGAVCCVVPGKGEAIHVLQAGKRIPVVLRQVHGESVAVLIGLEGLGNRVTSFIVVAVIERAVVAIAKAGEPQCRNVQQITVTEAEAVDEINAGLACAVVHEAIGEMLEDKRVTGAAAIHLVRSASTGHDVAGAGNDQNVIAIGPGDDVLLVA